MKATTNWYWKQNQNEHIVIILTRTIVTPVLDVSLIKNIADIPRSVVNKNQSRQDIQ